jgi:hypothetical protein
VEHRHQAVDALLDLLLQGDAFLLEKPRLLVGSDLFALDSLLLAAEALIFQGSRTSCQWHRSKLWLSPLRLPTPTPNINFNLLIIEDSHSLSSPKFSFNYKSKKITLFLARLVKVQAKRKPPDVFTVFLLRLNSFYIYS